MEFLSLNNIDVTYDKKKTILKGLDLEVKEGELVSLLGPSGCGKTTTLRVIAGFIEPTCGEFILDGKNYTKIPVHKRNFGIVFQSYALFPHLSVFDNVAFGLKLQKLSKEEVKQRVDKMLEISDLSEFANRFPKQMSGGQRQRVALARALVIQPKLLLLDEPLSNLDAKLRVNMRVEIKRIQKKLGITTIFVTHDQEECFSISDRVAVMNNGVIEQYDTPENIYSRPKTEFVARFIGFENFIELKKQSNHLYSTNENENIYVENENSLENGLGTIRPEDIRIVDEDFDKNIIVGTIGVRTFLGKAYQYEVNTLLGKLIVNAPIDIVHETGEQVKLYLPENKIILVKK